MRLFRSRPLLPLAALALGALTLAACDSTDPGGGAGEEELFTTVVVTLTPAGGGKPYTFTATDPDGNGAGITYAQSLPLPAGTYDGAVTLRDDRNGVDMTADVVDERDAHQFFYAFTPTSGASRLTISDRNTDENGLPFGRTFTATVAAGAAGTGTLRLVLAHYDGVEKRASDTIDSRPGTDTDLDLAYPVALQ